MKFALTEKILLLLADFMDMSVNPYNMNWRLDLIEGDPRYSRYRPWRAELEKYLRKGKLRSKLYSAVHQLKNSDQIEIKKIKGKNAIHLTQKGERRLLEIKVKSTEKKERSDKRWAMVIFDIPEKKRRLRNIFRRMLYELGYKKFQRSVWLSPYDVIDETEEIIKTLYLEKFVNCFLVEEAETGKK